MIRKISILCLILSNPIFSSSDNPIKQSVATLESDVGEMIVEMIQLEDGKWKLRSYLDGGRLVQREEIEYLHLKNSQKQKNREAYKIKSFS